MNTSGRGVTDEQPHLVDVALPQLVDVALPESGQIDGRRVTVTVPSLVDVALRRFAKGRLWKPFIGTTALLFPFTGRPRPFHASNRRQELCL